MGAEMEATSVSAGATMARKPAQDHTQVKLDTEVVRAARIVSAYREVTMADYLSELLRPLVMKDLAAEQTKGTGAQPPKRSRKSSGQGDN